MLMRIQKCDSYLPEVFINPDKVTHVFTVTKTNGIFKGKINGAPYTVIILESGNQITTLIPLAVIVDKLNGLVV